MSDPSPDISVIVPIGQRFGDVTRLLDSYAMVLDKLNRSFEFIIVLDGPHGALREQLETWQRSRPDARVIEHAREFGESAALTTGFAEASGQWILTLPGYEQVAPGEIQKLVALESTADMLIAVRAQRSGSPLARSRRAGFHGLIRWLTGQRFRDLSCSMRFFRREITEEIPLYSDRHHFYPLLANSRGFSVTEVEVVQGQGDVYRGPRSVRQYLHRMLDILTLFFLTRFIKKPLRFFGTVGFLVTILGVIALAIVIYQRLVLGIGLADRPALLLGSLMLVLGVQIFALGLIGELVIFTHANELKEYAVRRVIGRKPSSADVESPPGERGKPA